MSWGINAGVHAMTLGKHERFGIIMKEIIMKRYEGATFSPQSARFYNYEVVSHPRADGASLKSTLWMVGSVVV
jgi:hypothetical protein